MSDKFYAIWDNVVNQGVIKFILPDLASWSTIRSFDEHTGRVRGLHLFSTVEEAREAIKAITASLLRSDKSNRINFSIFELTEPHTLTSYKCTEIKP